MQKKLLHTLYTRYIFISGILCAIFLSYSLLFIHFTTRKNEEANIEYLMNAANQLKLSIQKQITGDFQTLDGIAICLGLAEINDPYRLNQILRLANDSNTFIRMGVADLEGNLKSVDLAGKWHTSCFNGSQEFFNQAKEGKRVISPTMEDPFLSDTYINYYCVPVKNKLGQITSILCSVNTGFMFRNIIDSPMLNSNTYSHIINSSGDMVIRGRQPVTVEKDPTSIFDFPFMDPGQENDIKSALSKNKSSTFTIADQNNMFHAVLLPLGVEDWFVVSMISKSELNRNYRMTALGTTALIAVAFFIFTVLFYQQRTMEQKNNRMLTQLAYYDELTGCINFNKFLIDLPESTRGHGQENTALWYCDIKRFKYLNDIYGYEMGDSLLQDLARSLERLSHEKEIFCRISADNFAGVHFYEDKAQLSAWFHSLLEELRSEKSHIINTSALDLCMGFYCFDEFSSSIAPEDMINRANMAQKAAKELPGSSCVFFSEDLRQKIAVETETAADAKRALANKEFIIYLQPKINIQLGNRMTGAEVLVRWNHHEKGMIPPGNFIPLFEKNGMIIQLDRYIYEEACRWFQEYLDSGYPPINLSINVSRIDLSREDFAEFYISIKEKYLIPDHLLELEFTESVILDDNAKFLNIITRLQDHGITCSLDDFGTGYSSLNLLKNLPIDVLKLDIMFFRNSLNTEREQIVIANIINMARQLRIKTVAEGVEEARNVSFLRETGCNIVQGYVFSRPMPLDQFNHMLKENPQPVFQPNL